MGRDFVVRHPKLNSILSIIVILVWTVGCILLVQFLLAFLFRFLVDNFHLHSPIMQTIYSVLTYVVAGAIIIFLPPRLAKCKKSLSRKEKATSKISSKANPISKDDLGLTGWPTWTDIGLAPVGFIVYVILAAVTNGVFSIFSWYNASEAQNVGFSQYVMGFDRVLAFFTLVIVSPIAEELIFRGYLYIKLKKSVQKMTAKSARRTEIIAIIIASLLTSLAFAVLHGQWNVGVNVFMMSLVLCAMREITGTIYSGIIMHMIKNAVAFFLVFVVNLSF